MTSRLPAALLAALPLLSGDAVSAASRQVVELRDRGLAQLENEKDAEAETTYRELTSLAPEEPLGYGNLAIALLRQQEFPGAIEAVEEALRLAPGRADLLAIRGEVLTWSGDRENALGALTEAGRTAPDDMEILYRLYQHATSLRGDEAGEQARWSLGRLYELRPENLFVLLKKGQEALADEDREVATAVYLRVGELLWQAPEIASQQLEVLLEALTDGDLSETRRPAIVLDNVLKAEVMYQRGLDELRTDIQGIPVDFLLDETELGAFGHGIDVRFRTTLLSDVATVSAALAVGYLDGDTRPDTARLVADDAGPRLEIRLGREDWRARPLEPAPRADTLQSFDLDNDGAHDLLAVGTEVGFWKGTLDGDFVESRRLFGLPTSAGAAAAFDFDIEGDLDLVSARDGGRLELYRNALDGPLQEIGELAFGSLGELDVLTVKPSDLDRDGDLDLLVGHSDGLVFLRNLRQGRFVDATTEAGLGIEGAVVDLETADLDHDGLPEVLILGDGLQVLANSGGVFSPSRMAPQAPSGATSMSVFDADNDGRPDLLFGGESGVHVLLQRDGAAFTEAPVDDGPSAVTAVDARDLDLDGDLDVVAAGPDGLFHLENEGGHENHSLVVQLRGLDVGDSKNNLFGLGSWLEVKLGEAYQFVETSGPVTHLGLGSRRRADVLRITWTNGVPQNRLGPAVFQPIVERQILKGSCPFLYTQTSSGIEFVTDLLWGAPLGMPLAEGVWAGADPHELVVVEGAVSIDGTYDLRITEELWETAYFDRTRLWVVDIPEELEVASTLRIVPGEVVDDRMVASGGARPLAAALDGQGRHVLDRVARRDEIYADGYEPSRYQGVADEPWAFTMDLGAAPAQSVRLLLDGWIFPADASLNLAVSQRSRPPVLTRLEVETADGWQVLMPKMGHPAGKTKTLVVDTPPLPPGSSRLRIVTSRWLAWDRIAWTVDPRDDEVDVRARLEPTSARLGYRGFSELVRSAPNAPHRFDYDTVTTDSPWLRIDGRFTRYGDVAELLRTADDRSVILAPGDELRLRFDASAIPPPAPGHARVVVLESVGWDKDADRNTWAGEQVEPLPFRAMSGYPYAPGEEFPDTLEMRRYRREWLTREMPDDAIARRPVVSATAAGGGRQER